MEETYSEAQARRLGYPLGVCGYSPNERFYWHEPTLGWANSLLNATAHGLDPVAAARELATLYALPLVWNENMAPRFVTGTFLAGKPLAYGDKLAVGAVLLWTEPGDAADCPTLARLVAVEPTGLRLACDNGGQALWLPWTADTALAGVYRVTHYVSQPYRA